MYLAVSYLPYKIIEVYLLGAYVNHADTALVDYTDTRHRHERHSVVPVVVCKDINDISLHSLPVLGEIADFTGKTVQTAAGVCAPLRILPFVGSRIHRAGRFAHRLYSVCTVQGLYVVRRIVYQPVALFCRRLFPDSFHEVRQTDIRDVVSAESFHNSIQSGT